MPKLQMQIELTNNCNFRCSYCPHSIYGEPGPAGNSFNRPKGFMAEPLFDKAVAEAGLHAKSLSLGFFGEQQLHKRFDSFVLRIPKKRSYKVFYNTNWSLATESSIPALNRFDVVRISLDSTDAKRWEDELCPGGAILRPDGGRGEGRFDTLVRKIKWWLSHPARQSAVYLIYVRQTINDAETQAFVDEWRPLMSHPEDRIVTKSILTYGGVMFDPYMEENECRVVSENRFTVAWDGRCTPCNLDVNLAMATHNLNEMTVAQILASPEWAATLDGIRKRKGICANCFDANNHGKSYYSLPVLSSTGKPC